MVVDLFLLSLLFPISCCMRLASAPVFPARHQIPKHLQSPLSIRPRLSQ
jgi:hypothetical protein